MHETTRLWPYINVIAEAHITRVRLLSQVLKMKTIDIIKPIIAHGLPTFRVLNKTKVDINIKSINSVSPEIPEVSKDRNELYGLGLSGQDFYLRSETESSLLKVDLNKKGRWVMLKKSDILLINHRHKIFILILVSLCLSKKTHFAIPMMRLFGFIFISMPWFIRCHI
jgi:hypothetical protein